MHLGARHAAAAQVRDDGLDAGTQHQRSRQHQLRKRVRGDAQAGEVRDLRTQLALWLRVWWGMQGKVGPEGEVGEECEVRQAVFGLRLAL